VSVGRKQSLEALCARRPETVTQTEGLLLKVEEKYPALITMDLWL